jgi:hypothetical protein
MKVMRNISKMRRLLRDIGYDLVEVGNLLMMVWLLEEL